LRRENGNRFLNLPIQKSCQYPRHGRLEAGFTIIELAITVVLLGIALTVVTLNYANSRKALTIRSGTSEVEGAMKRCYEIAKQEGVDVYLQFWDGTGNHPNQFAIYRVIYKFDPATGTTILITDERTNDEPTESPQPGVGSTTDGNGHYWFKISNGAVAVQAPVTLRFQREGTRVIVSSEAGGMSVTLTHAGRSGTVTINELGEVSS